MRKALITFAALLAAGAFAADSASSQRHREVLQLNLVDGGTLPAPMVGGLAYDVLTGGILSSDGGPWAAVPTGAATTVVPSYVVATFDAGQLTNLTAGDHFKFNVVVASGGDLNQISLDTTTAYTKSDNVASLGRFTLVGDGGIAYELTLFVPLSTSSSASGNFDFAWYNGDTGAFFSTGTTTVPNSLVTNFGASPTLGAVFVPTANTRVEVRISNPAFLTGIGAPVTMPDGGTLGAYPIAFIRALP